MRLVGVQLPPAVVGGDGAFIRLDDVSVLLGANDTGKTRILRAVSNGLAAVDIGPRGDDATRPSFYVRLDASPSRWLDEEWDYTGGRGEVHFLEDRRIFGRVAYDRHDRRFLRAFTDVSLEQRRESRRDPLERCVAVLRRIAELQEEEWSPLFEWLKTSDYALIRPASTNSASGWAIDWCLPPRAECEDAVADRLAALGLSSRPAHGQPMAVTPLLPWLVNGRGLPEARIVPGLPGTLSDVQDRLAALRRLAVPADIPRNAFRDLATTMVERLTTSRLPPFVLRHYRVDLLTDRQGSQDAIGFVRIADGLRLPPEEMADGYRVWIEIALVDAIVVAERALDQIIRIATNDATLPEVPEAIAAHLLLHEHGGSLSNAMAGEPSPTSAALADIASSLARERVAADAYSYIGSPGTDRLTVAAGSRTDTAPLFIVDEPERHLHPRLQREAANWVQTISDENRLRGQILLATHSVAMLGLSRAVAYTYVHRPASATITVPLPEEQLTALDIASGELGFDRGELLTLRRVIAFVEGEVDRLVLIGLFRQRLRESGIELVPIHGTRKMAAIVDADLLFNLMRQRIAVVVDNIVQSRLPDPRDLNALEQLDRQRGRASDSELKKVGALLLAAHRAGRRVEINAIPGPDIIAELDEATLREVQGLDYPGHKKTLDSWEHAVAGGSGIGWKSHCVGKGWLSADPDDVRPVVERMHDQGRVPSSLLRVLDWLEDLAAEVDR